MKRVRQGWERLSVPGNKLRQEFRHVASGWLVKHCGHPTANQPWHGLDRLGRLVVSHNGMAFRYLDAAMEGVEFAVFNPARLKSRDSKYGEVVCVPLLSDGEECTRNLVDSQGVPL